MEDCLFCGIVAGDVPAQIVDSDEHTVSFLDINPDTRGHALVIPRTHSAGLMEISDEDLERMRILAARPRWGREIDERILPAEAGLDETHISFAPEKGCYPGQEPVARLHYRGKANRELRVLEVEGAPAPETEVLDGEKAVGRVTSSVPGLALAYIRTTVPSDAAMTVDGTPASLR